MNLNAAAFWSLSSGEALQRLNASEKGLSSAEASARLAQFGPNTLAGRRRAGALSLLLSQFKSPIILLLLFAAILSLGTRDVLDGAIILLIVVASSLLSFWQEKGATGAVEKLLSVIEVKSAVLRDAQEVLVSSEDVVPGDVVVLRAGSVVPADGLILQSKELFANEASLTGESFPVEKQPGQVAADSSISQRTNSCFAGTYITSGTGNLLIVQTGIHTEFGQISTSLRQRPPESEFERGIRHFGYLLMEITMVLTISIFAINVYLHRPVIESFLFALALAVGLTPQLLPAIISVNLSHGARSMAKVKVIVKKLSSIENFGSMNILCTDKTGTLTEGTVVCHAFLDLHGAESDKVKLFTFLNSKFQSGYTNPIDEAVMSQPVDVSGYAFLDEIPYDFVRRRLSILVQHGPDKFLISKGALSNVLEVCGSAEAPDGSVVPIEQVKPEIETRFQAFSSDGFRTIAIAYKRMESSVLQRNDEEGLRFLGYLLLLDPLKAGVAEDVERLRSMGVRLKMITGDNRHVAATVGKLAGIEQPQVLAGPDMRHVSGAALAQKVRRVDIFAEVEPNQKEQIIYALKRAGEVVGYLGDGINDAAAIHAADVGISVSNAVDVAKEAADIVLLEKDLSVLENGVREGRITFANTLKYVFMSTSANFGNMFSMAGASLFLPFLPLLPRQILLNNMLTDFPEMTISTDSIDPEMVEGPRRWDIGFIKRFMLVFGLASSMCDYITFAILLLLMHTTPIQFRTGWFIESTVSAAMIVLVIRTRRFFTKSKPSRSLLIATVAVTAASMLIPYTPAANVLGFTPLPVSFLFAVLGILVFYVAVAELCKVWFYSAHTRLRARVRA